IGRERRVHRTSAGVRYMVPVFSEHEFVEAWPADKRRGPNIPFKPEFSHLAKFQTPQVDCLRTRVEPERCSHRAVTDLDHTAHAANTDFNRNERNHADPKREPESKNQANVRARHDFVSLSLERAIRLANDVKERLTRLPRRLRFPTWCVERFVRHGSAS